MRPSHLFALLALVGGVFAQTNGRSGPLTTEDERDSALPAEFHFTPTLSGSFASLEVDGQAPHVLVGISGVAKLLGGRFGGGSQAITTDGIAGSGDVMSISWESDHWFSGDCKTVTVRYERSPGQSQDDALEEFQDLVAQAAELYPPSCSHDAAGSSGIVFGGGATAAGARGQLPWAPEMNPGEEGGSLPMTEGTQPRDVLSIDWEHDFDGNGPLKPVRVTASVEKRPNEGSASAARRLGKLAKALAKVFPPNVPKPAPPPMPPGGGG